MCMMREVGDEPAVEVGEAHEGLHLLLGHGYWPLHDSSNLDRVHLNMILGDDDAEVHNMCLLKIAFVMLQIEFVLAQALHDYLAGAVMFFQGISEDEDIVQVDDNHPL